MKLICLIGQLGNGGSEKQLYSFLKNLDTDRYDPIVIASSTAEGIWRKRISEDIGCRIISLGTKPAPILKIIRFRLLVSKFKPDLILSWSFYTNAYSIVTAKKYFIGCLRGELEAAEQHLRRLNFKLSLRPLNFLVNSNMLRNEMIEYGIPPHKIHFIQNMIELDFSQGQSSSSAASKKELRTRYGIKDDEILVAGIGRNAPEKDFSFFVKVFAEALSTNNSLRAILVGTGGTGVKEEIDRLGLSEKFIITGEIPSAKNVLPCVDIFFLSSIYEGMPNVLLEALEAKCAILAMDVGGVRDILGDDNPYFKKMVPSDRNVQNVSEMLLGLAASRELRTEISEYNWKTRITQFTHEKTMPLYYSLFESVLSSR